MKKFLSLLLLSLLFVACNPSETAFNDLQKFTERIEQKSDNWSAADWDEAVLHYADICQTLDNYEYTDEQKREIGKLKGRCKAKFAKHSLDENANGMHDALIELGGAVEGLLEGLGK
jgi:hypothetical protein